MRPIVIYTGTTHAVLLRKSSVGVSSRILTLPFSFATLLLSLSLSYSFREGKDKLKFTDKLESRRQVVQALTIFIFLLQQWPDLIMINIVIRVLFHLDLNIYLDKKVLS